MLSNCIVLDDEKVKAALKVYAKMDIDGQIAIDKFLYELDVSIHWSDMWERYQLRDGDYDPDFF